MTKLRWLLVALATVGVLVVGLPWLYINVIEGDPPARLSLADVTTSTTPSPTSDAQAVATTNDTAAATANDDIDGAWTVSDGSQAGYRVAEVLFGQDTEAVGRTSDVTGDLTISGTTVTGGSFTVDLTTVSSDQSRRDGQFHNRIMETATYPTATFELTQPIDFDTVPSDDSEVSAKATGDLTMHGVTKSVTFDLVATSTSGSIAVNGSIPVTFSDFDIRDASFGPATVQDHGEIEFLLVLGKRA